MQAELLTRQGPRVFRVVLDDGHRVECVDATLEEERGVRRVYNLSTLIGCPVRCAVCDAGGDFKGKLTCAELFAQLEVLIQDSFAGRKVTVGELVVELTRMGEPSFSRGVLEFLCLLPARYPGVRVVPVVSSVAPARTEAWFEELLEVKARVYAGRELQLQLSLFTTDEVARRRMVPIKVQSFAALAAWGARWGEPRIVLHFPVTSELPVEAQVLRAAFDPRLFLVKLSPVTPTEAAAQSGFTSGAGTGLAESLRAQGYQVELGRGGPDDAAACGAFFSSGLGPVEPRRTRAR